MKHRSLQIALLLLSLFSFPSAGQQFLIRHNDGSNTPIQRILISPSAAEPVRLAGSALQSYLRKSLHADLPIAEGQPEKGAFHISVSDSAPYLEGQFDRTVVSVRNGGIVLTGENPRAALYAVYDFLQACLGIRFFGPGEAHEVVPVRDTLALDDAFELRQGSAFEFRDYYLPNPDNTATIDFLVKNRVNTFCIVAPLDAAPQAIRLRGGFTHGPGHIFREFLPDPVLFEQHPEYFPLEKGQRTITGKGACFSNPEVRRIFVHRLRAFLHARPVWDIFALWAEDTAYEAYCECPDCAKVSTGGWYMTLINEAAPVVEQELPNALFEFIAYHETRWPPKEVTPLYKNGKSMILNICIGYSRNGFYPLASRKDGNAEVLDMYNAWARRLEEVGFEARRILFDYYNRCEVTCGHGPSGQSLIWPMDVIAEDTRFYLRDGIRGVGDWVCFSRLCWPTPFNVWCWLQLYTDPGRSLDELEADFYSAYFGNDGPAVRDYTHALQATMYADTTPENIDRVAGLRSQLDALIEAQPDPVLKHRLEVVRNHHDYALLLKRIWLAFAHNDEPSWRGMLQEYNDFYPVTHRDLLQNEIDIPSQFMNLWTEYHLKRPPEQIPEVLKGLTANPSSR